MPLSDPALALLDAAAGERVGLVFPAPEAGRELHDTAISYPLKQLGLDVTVHGFRTSFRSWVANTRRQDGDIAELCLQHQTRDATERAYYRDEHLSERRELLAAWAAYLTGAGQKAEAKVEVEVEEMAG